MIKYTDHAQKKSGEESNGYNMLLENADRFAEYSTQDPENILHSDTAEIGRYERPTAVTTSAKAAA